MVSFASRYLAVLVLMVAGLCTEGAPRLPPNLPPPPPLPPGLLEKRPMELPPDLPDPAELISQLKQLEELLSLTPQKLAALRQTLEFIEKMSPEEREAMRIRLSQVTRMTPGLREEINGLATLLPPAEKTNLTQFWLAASEADRAALRAELADLPMTDQSRLLATHLKRFIAHRDAVFEKMRNALEEKRRIARPPRN